MDLTSFFSIQDDLDLLPPPLRHREDLQALREIAARDISARLDVDELDETDADTVQDIRITLARVMADVAYNQRDQSITRERRGARTTEWGSTSSKDPMRLLVRRLKVVRYHT